MKTKTLLFAAFFLPIAYCLLPTYLFSQTPGEWTWMHGDSISNSLGVFGVQGVPGPANKPPALYEPCEWKDNNGNFWIFGGKSINGRNAALWKYDPGINQWTWMKGPSVLNQSGVYGIQGVSAPANYPGARGWGVASWVDTSGNLWLFGGVGNDAFGGYGTLNDLWKYNISANEWTWIKGPNTANDSGSYGTKGIPDPANLPPSRNETSCSWTDSTGSFWLYGGSNWVGNLFGDLWKYTQATNEWTWMHGSNTVNPPAVYGIQGVGSSANTPGGRQVYCSWIDLTGNLWLFGGRSPGVTNALWKYNIATNQWTWIKGTNITDDPGNYGVQCVSANNNMPPARYENRARVRDACGNFWNFGGLSSGGGSLDVNDMWHYNVSTNQWTWVSGDNIPNQAAVHGTQGQSAPTNKPGSRNGSVAWMDTNGYIWVFGGLSMSPINFYNDLFRYVPDTICVPLSSVVTISSNITICNGQNATLTASGGATYQWSPGGQTAASIVVSPGTSSTYTVIGSNSCGSDTTSVTVTVSPLPSITAPSNITICNGQTATLTALGGTNYSWSPGGQSASSIMVNPTALTIYTVTDSNACGLSSSSVTVTVNTIPVVTTGNNATITAGNSATLSSSSNPSSVTYIWSPAAGLSCSNCQNPVAAPTATTVYCVTVTDGNGCTDDTCLTITVEPIVCPGKLYLPNAFSPNGDGENDMLQIYYGNILCIKDFHLIIFDRWGEKVFATTNPAAKWDGSYKAKREGTAVFVYYMEAILISGEEIIKKGNVSLIR